MNNLMNLLRTVRQVAARGGGDGLVARRVHSPPFSRRGGGAIHKKIPFLSGADGVFSKRSCSLLMNVRVAHLNFCWNSPTTPSAQLRHGTFLLRRSHPSLKTEGNELASTAVIDFEIACLRQSPEIRCLCAPHPFISQRVGQDWDPTNSDIQGASPSGLERQLPSY